MTLGDMKKGREGLGFDRAVKQLAEVMKHLHNAGQVERIDGKDLRIAWQILGGGNDCLFADGADIALRLGEDQVWTQGGKGIRINLVKIGARVTSDLVVDLA